MVRTIVRRAAHRSAAAPGRIALSRALALLLLLVLGPDTALAQSGGGPDGPEPLFLGATDAGGVPPAGEVGLTRVRRAPTAPGVLDADRLRVNLFADATFVAVRGVADPARVPASAWVGELEDAPGSLVVLLDRGAGVVGTVRTSERLYRVVADPTSGLRRIEELDETRLPTCATDDGPVDGSGGRGAGGNGSGSGGAAPVSAPLARVDVLGLYTTTAASAAGGAQAMEDLIELAVLETNLAWERSGISHLLACVHKAEIAYDEAGTYDDHLGRLRGASDGWMDEVHTLRVEHGADLVSLIVQDASYCGIGYVMTNPSAGFAGFGFSVVARGCAVGHYSFAHELGHNLGCHHDHDHPGTGAHPWSYGHRGATGNWRTIMAYAPGTRIGHFSNPAVAWQGEPTGVDRGQAGEADNAGTITATAPIVAAFRTPPVEAYGAGKPSSTGQTPELGAAGEPSLTTSGSAAFRLAVTSLVPNAAGVLWASDAEADVPFAGGTLLVAQPYAVALVFDTTDTGALELAPPTHALTPGATRHYQVAFRDLQHADGTGTGLTNGLRVTWRP